MDSPQQAKPKRMWTVVVGAFISIALAMYSLAGIIMVGSFSATPNYSIERAQRGFVTWTSTLVVATLGLIWCCILIVQRIEPRRKRKKL